MASNESSSKFRPEIQALRALSVMLVVTFHLWPELLPGGYVGVDVFFVISGYLITSHLVKEISTTGGLSLPHFYARRIRRLLPAALLVLAVTLVGVLTLAPRSLFQRFVTDIAASATYLVNWVLADRAVDYFAEGGSPSPVQHFWSLAVEEQFYIVWPILLLSTALVVRKQSARVRTRVMVAVLATVFAASLVYSVVVTAASPRFAYFATPSHAWEFAAGGFLAMAGLTRRRAAGGRWRSVLSWLGFGAIAVAAIRFDGDSLFPGWIALVPVGGALAVMAAGDTRPSWSPRVLVTSRPVQFIGGISYSLYLWHWVPIALLPYLIHAPLDDLHKVGILVQSILLGWLTRVFVEDPVRRAALARRRVTFGAAAIATAALVAACVVPYVVIQRGSDSVRDYIAAEQPVLASATTSCFGAAAMEEGADCVASHQLGEGLWTDFALKDRTRDFIARHKVDDPFFRLSCGPVKGKSITRCEVGRPDALRTVVLVGDSHADVLLVPLAELAKENDWHVIELWRSSCRPALPVYATNVPREDGSNCRAWKRTIFDYVSGLSDVDVDVIVTTGATQGYYDAPRAPAASDVARGFGLAWSQWLESGTPVLAVSDVPSYGDEWVPECVDSAPSRNDPCSVPRKVAIRPDAILMEAGESSRPDFGVLDLYPSLCDDQRCHAVVGGLVAYADSNHLTATFARSLAPQFEEAIRGLWSAARVDATP